ncbi:MAG: hypothetical protein J6W52_06670 [Bacteroidaceae bacterium]|nr:hypothetical protein [Bacteroidaceae bacterium]
MKKRFLYIVLFVGAIFALSACSDSIDLDDEQNSYESIAIVYWMGDNSLSSWAEEDVKELVLGMDNIPTNSKIVIYADKENAFPVIYQLDADNGLKIWKEYAQEEDCTDSLTLLTNLKDIITNFPAKSYGLTFGAHGSGWTWQRRALGPDNSHSGKWLNIPTLRGVLEQLPHFSYIFFDVCFMQSAEVAFELRKVADWVISSPAEIPNPGAPYHLITEALCKGDVYGIVNGYDSYYPRSYKNPVTQNEQYFEGVVLSAAKCSEMDSFAATTNRFIKNTFANRQTISGNTASRIQKYSSYFSSYTYCYDVNSAMYNILPAEDYSSWAEEFEKAVPLRTSKTGNWTATYCDNPTIYDSEHFGGISMYIPKDDYDGNIKNADLKRFQWYKAAGWDQTGW